MGRPCGCGATEGCTCIFSADGDITAAGGGSEDSPLVLSLRDGYLTPIVCTSTSHPTEEKGRVIFETDTGYLRVWNGTRWRLIDPSTIGNDDFSQLTFTTHVGNGPHTLGTITIPQHFGVGDRFTAQVCAQYRCSTSVSLTAWVFTLLDPDGNSLAGAVQFEHFLELTGNLGPCSVVSPAGSDLAVTLQAERYGGDGIAATANLTVISYVAGNYLRAHVHAN